MAKPQDETPEEPERDEVIAENERLVEAFLSSTERELASLEEELPPDHRAGYVAVVGKPNVGKSTLMNAFLGEKVAIVTPKPQTTRQNQLGILTRRDAQVIFVDTPGIHLPRTKLGEYMVATAREALHDADVILFIVDVSELPDAADRAIADLLRQSEAPVILALNKVDLLSEAQAEQQARFYQALLPQAEPILLSATTGYNRDALLERLIQLLPRGPRYYPADQLTDMQLRDNAAEIIREQVLLLYDQEVPHSVAVQVDQFKERSADMTYIAATIYVERESQKKILIGSGGSALKEVGRRAREQLEAILGTRVYLELWVKVLKNWRKDEKALRRLGYKLRR